MRGSGVQVLLLAPLGRLPGSELSGEALFFRETIPASMVGTLLRLLLSAFSPQTDAVPGKALLPDLDRSAAETAPADGAWHGLDDEAALAAWVENVRTNFALPCSRTTEENVMVPFFLGLPSDPFADCPGTAESLREELRAVLELERQIANINASDLSRYPFAIGAAEEQNNSNVSPYQTETSYKHP